MKKLNNIEKNKISKIKILNSSVKDKSQSEVKNSKNTNFTLIQSKKSNEVKRNFCVNTTNEYITVKLNKNNIKNTGKINLISSKKNKLIDKGLDENYVQTENTLKVRPFTKDEVFSTKQDLIKMSSNNFSVGNSENFKIFKEKETTYSKNIKLQSQNETVNIIPSEALNSNSSRKSDNMNKYLARKLFLPSSIHNLKNKDLIVILNFLSYKEIHLIINSNTIFSNRVSKLIQKTAKNLENNISQNLQKFNQFDLFECFIISTTQGLKLFCILKRKEISLENI